jgi:uncharacterized protein YfaS (alpha-2-macroglobulin family)
MKESGADPAALRRLVSLLPGANLDPASLDTQEQAWGAAAAAALGAGAQPVSVSVDGRKLQRAAVPLTGPVKLRNEGTAPIWQTVSISGVPRVAPAASRNLMQVHRNFFTPAGETLNPDKLPQNTVFVLVIDGKAEDGQDHQAMVLAGLPAGWEIAGRLPGGKVPGMDWLDELTDPNSQTAADDRYAAAFDLTEDKPTFRLAVMLRAVTPGEYEYPGIELADMYRPGIYARQGAVRVTVLPP